MFGVDDRLTKKKARTDGVMYSCKNHPELRWHGKNIRGRSLFFFGDYQWKKVTEEGILIEECSCPFSDLVMLDVDGPDVPE